LENFVKPFGHFGKLSVNFQMFSPIGHYIASKNFVKWFPNVYNKSNETRE